MERKRHWAWSGFTSGKVPRDKLHLHFEHEEETGGVIAGRPHPELFLEYPRGLQMDITRFEKITLMPAAARFRAALDEHTQRRGWPQATAVTTLFLEGTEHERGELDPDAPR